jgi:transcriptional regulator with XRE-family HTH domain
VRRRAGLKPGEATTEGARRLRALCERQTFSAVARRARCDESAIRRYAREIRSPLPEIRARLEDVFGIPAGAWDEPAKPDTYDADEPSTAKRGPPTTKARR